MVGRNKETRARQCGFTRIPTRLAWLSPTGAVSDETAQTPSLSQRVPATQNKKPPCNNTWWTEIKRTVQSPPLCLHRERRLRHSPTVVAGSSVDHRCTGTKKEKRLVYGVQQAQTAPRRRQGERTKRPPLPSPLGLRRGCPSRRTRRRRVPVTKRRTAKSSNTSENGNTWTQALLARDELDGWPDLRP